MCPAPGLVAAAPSSAALLPLLTLGSVAAAQTGGGVKGLAAASRSTTPPPNGGSGTDIDPLAARVWTEENLVSSCGQTKVVTLSGLPQGAQELKGHWASVSGQTTLQGRFLHPAFLTPESKLTNDPFDQVQCYYAVTSLMYYLEGLGFSMPQILGALRPVVALVNAVDDLNAWFSPTTGELTFGTAKKSRFGEWHLASDQDIVRHETGHLTLHALNRALTSWYSGDGGAIHEGFGDAVPSLYRDDPEVGEDFPANVGRESSPDIGLRTVANEILYHEAGREVHDLGRVYGGWWWGVRVALEQLLGDARAAADMALAFVVNHGAHYATNRPGPKDFLEANLLGAQEYLRGRGRGNVDFERVKAAMVTEADRRAMLSSRIKKMGRRKRVSAELGRLLAGGSGAFAFLQDFSTKGTFWGRDFLQQYLAFDHRHLVRMLGSGIIIFRSEGGIIQSYSDSDMRGSVRVNTTVNYGPRAALNRVRKAAERILHESERRIEDLSRLEVSSEAEERNRNIQIDWGEIERRADERAFTEAMALEDPARAELVLMPEGYGDGSGVEDLHWRFTFHFSEFYVNARTGRVAVEKMPLWKG